MNKILLIEPPFYRLFHDKYSLERYPLSLGYLAGAIKKNTDWDVMVYNADFVPCGVLQRMSYLAGAGFTNYKNNLSDPLSKIWDEVKSVITSYKPAVVGITAKTQTFKSAGIVARIAKEIDGKIVVIAGGPHPTMAPSDVIERREFDIAVRGEGEMTIVELLNNMQARERWSRIRGILYREDGQVRDTGPREFIGDLDSLSFPGEFAEGVLKDYKKYPRTAFSHIFATRGCPYNCWFCGSKYVWGRSVRYRSPQNVAMEIRLLQARGIDYIQFDDDTFGINRKYIADLCDCIARRVSKIKWSCEMHVKLVDDGLIKMMKECGCDHITLGIESGNNEILKKARKDITIEEAMAACSVVKRHGVHLSVFFMVGLPWETPDTLKDTLKAIREIGADVVYCSIFMPYPGTESFEYCKEKGLIPLGFDYSSYNHQSPENCFCLNMERGAFRKIVSDIEKEVDRINFKNRRDYVLDKVKTLSISEIRRFGWRNSLRKAVSLFRG